jgi:GH3 auxin-responsive promoter
MKKNVLRPFRIPLEKTVEKQEQRLEKKLRLLERTEIGRKLGLSDKTKLRDVPVTRYEFYESFFNNPTPQAFMYPLQEYERTRTSGTSGKEKWFIIPREYMTKTIIETAIPMIMLATHDGEKIAMEYGDTVYVNTAPRPFVGGVMISLVSGKREKPPLFRVVPNFNIPFEDKVKHFVNNSDKIDIAITQASIVVSQIIPALKRPICLKGLFCLDTPIAEMYSDKIAQFTGVVPRTAFASTETLHCSIPSVDHPLGFFMDWRRGLFEFIPLKQESDDKSSAAGINEVKVGGIYRVIFTSLESELTRYDTMNALECVAQGDDILDVDCPIFKFHSRLEKTISLHNFTRISEDELISVFREAGLEFAEFTTKTSTIEGLQYLTIYLETSDQRCKEELAKSIHEGLIQNDIAYKELVDFYHYVPTRVNLMPNGVFGKFLFGKPATVAKIERIDVSEEELCSLFETAWSLDPLWQPT